MLTQDPASGIGSQDFTERWMMQDRRYLVLHFLD
jgi:hypothetical protein